MGTWSLAEAKRQWETVRSRNEDRIELALSLVIGALVGLVVVAFILLTGRLAARMYPPESAAIRRVLVPVVGARSLDICSTSIFPRHEAAVSRKPNSRCSSATATSRCARCVGKFVCCSGSLASGIALGREGPSVQIGAGIASLLARRFNLRPERVRALVPVGCAAALAAAFNTPIAAVLFSLEEILGDLHAPVLGSVVLSSATSWMTLHLILGDEPLFHVPAYHLVNPTEFLVYVVLGLVGGLGSVLFVKMLLNARLWFRSLPRETAWFQPAIGGLIVGLLGWFLPEVLGVGYDYVERVLGGDMAVRTIAVLAIAKIVATAMSYASGNAGGIFGPSLFIGAMMGGTVGSIAHSLFPAWTATPGAYALVGMGCAFAGIVRTPLTSVIMIFEMTRDYSVIVPLMIANLISFVVSYRLQREPIYEALAHQDGISLPTAEHEIDSGVKVSSAMRTDLPVIHISDDLESARKMMGGDEQNALPLVDDDGLVALVTLKELNEVQGDGTRKMADAFPAPVDHPFVHPDHALSVALERMGSLGINLLPVVNRANRRQMFGVVTLGDVLKAYGVTRTRT